MISRQIYEVILPEVVERLSTIFYHRSSPYGGVDTKDKTVGDLHQWNVWHGTQEPWANWDILKGRFVSYVLVVDIRQDHWLIPTESSECRGTRISGR